MGAGLFFQFLQTFSGLFSGGDHRNARSSRARRETGSLYESEQRLARYGAAISLLSPLGEKPKLFSPKLERSLAELFAHPLEEADSAAAKAEELNDQLIARRQTAGYLQSYLTALAPWQQEAFDRLHDDFFYRRHDRFWKESALRKLPVLQTASEMLPCGEDLGMIPACVPETMRMLQILSLEIQRMPKTFGEAFADPFAGQFFGSGP